MAVQGKGAKSKVPFPQYAYPGSPISPFTGKPYTKAEAARVHAQTKAAKLNNRRHGNSKSDLSDAVARRLARYNSDKSENKSEFIKPPKSVRDAVRGAKPKNMIAPPKPNFGKVRDAMNKLPIGTKEWSKVRPPVGLTGSARERDKKKREELLKQMQKSRSTRGGHRA